MTKTEAINRILRKLTFDDLRDWAGGTILSRGRNYVKHVDRLSRTPDNALAAWVTGGKQYATWARPTQDDLEYFCSCPYDWGGPCKHVIAVILAAAERVKAKTADPAPLDRSRVILTRPAG